MQAHTKRKRWLDNMIAAAKAESTTMPWERGSRRAAFVRRRSQEMSDAA